MSTYIGPGWFLNRLRSDLDHFDGGNLLGHGRLGLSWCPGLVIGVGDWTLLMGSLPSLIADSCWRGFDIVNEVPDEAVGLCSLLLGSGRSGSAWLEAALECTPS